MVMAVGRHDDERSPGEPANAHAGLLIDDGVAEVLHRDERTCVRRIRLPDGAGVICKEAFGPGSSTRLRNETQVLTRLAGVAGVPRLAAVSYPGAVVLEDDGGVSLAATIAVRRPVLSTMPAFALRLAEIVAGVHNRGLVHRDINPANILLVGDDRRPVLIDFDIATAFAEDRPGFTPRGEIVGTLAYLAPEQTGRTGLPVDHRADLYALGTVLYEMVGGHLPFEERDDLTLIRDILVRIPTPLADLGLGVPQMLSDIVARLLEKAPDQRYQSAGGLARDLTTLCEAPDRAFLLGEWDFAPRLSAPSQLIGRAAETAILREAFEEAAQGISRAVLVAGAAGVGKSTLINALRPMVAVRNGWFVAGKFDQLRTGQAAGAFVEAIRGIGRLLLAEPEEEVASTRQRLLDALGSNAALVTAVLPEFALLMGPQPVTEAGDPATADIRLRQGLLDLLRAVVSPERPVVMVVDDLQWTDPATLAQVDMVLTGEGLRGLLLVGAYRAQEVGPQHPLTAALARWERLGVITSALRLENLPPTELSTLLAAMLRLPAERAAELAVAVAAWTAGNPYDTVELVNTLRRDNVLLLGGSGWHWQSAAIRGYIGRGDVVELLKERIGRLPRSAREVLKIIACLGSEVRVDLLEVAAGCPADRLQRWLAPSLEDGLLIMAERGGPGGSSEDAVRFRHDRVQQAAYACLDPTGRDAAHLDLARRLARSPERAVEAAIQYAAAHPAGLAGDELRRVADLYRAAAANATRTSNHAGTEQFLAAAVDIWTSLGTRADDPTLIDVQIQRHAALYGLGRLDECDEVYAAIEGNCPDPVTLARTACLQVSSLGQRNRPRDALGLGLGLLRRLGEPVPADGDFGAAIAGRLDELVDWVQHLDLTADLDRPEITDARARAVERLFSRLLPNTFVIGELSLGAWLVLESRRMWAEHGPSGGLAANLSCVGLITARALGNFRIGYAAGCHVLAVAEARGYEPETSVLRHRHSLHVMPWVEPLENSIALGRQAHEGLVQGGDLQMASHTFTTTVAGKLECGRSLDAYAAQIDTALAFAEHTANPHSVDIVVGHRQLLRTLRGETYGPGDFDDAAFTEAAFVSALSSNRLASGSFQICRALAAALFDDMPALARYTATMLPLHGFVPGYQVSLAYLLRAMALAEQIRQSEPTAETRAGPLAELDDCRAWLAGRAADAPGNFLHLRYLVDAERAWAVDDFRGAVEAFDAATRAAEILQRPWHCAYIAERSAYFSFAHGLDGAGRRSLAEAGNRYESWGAVAKVSALERDHPWMRTTHRLVETDRGSGGPRRTGTVVADAIDTLAILRASQALGSETRLDRLNAVIVEQLTTLTGATEVLVVLRNDDTQTWFLPSTQDSGDATIPLEDATRLGLLPVTAFRYAERTREPLLVEDATRDDRFCRDRYLAGRERCSLLVVPILTQGTLRAVLMLANHFTSGAFTTDRLDAVMLIAGQLAVSLGNALLYGSLEQRVADRTEALAVANRQLEILSTTDSLTGLANRRHFAQVFEAEWQRAARAESALSIAMLDVDHFKKYNDHYGHLAGDRCLKRVAATLDSTTRRTDLVSRYGGEEFTAILLDTDECAAQASGERLRAAIAELAEPHCMTEPGVVTISVGVATVIPSDSSTAELLLARADTALYEAKDKGRNRVCWLPA
jgi:diguanylate cyclase (GGDEF)-like protein